MLGGIDVNASSRAVLRGGTVRIVRNGVPEKSSTRNTHTHTHTQRERERERERERHIYATSRHHDRSFTTFVGTHSFRFAADGFRKARSRRYTHHT